MNYKIICASTDLGVHVDGSDIGSKKISNHFKDYITLEKNNNIIKNKDPNNLKKNLTEVIKYNKDLYNIVSKTIEDNFFPITIGGDHSIAIASALASSTMNDEIGVIWIDAHTDYNTLETTKSGNIHGIPLACISGNNKKEVTTNLNCKYVDKSKIVIVGARSIDKLEQNNLNKDNIKIFTTNDIKKYGINNIMNEAFKIAGNKIHISYDLDIIDPSICPGVSVPEKNGINKKEAQEIMEYITKNKKYIKSLDLVEYNPQFDKNNVSYDIAVELLNIFISK